MTPARIDFLKPVGRSSRVNTVLLVLGALLAVAAMMDDSRYGDELSRVQERLKKARTAVTRALATQAANRGEVLSGLPQNGDIAARLASPWGGLLDALEQAQNDNIALLVLEPNAELGKLRLRGEAKDMNAIVDYIKSLNGKAEISELRLLNQQVKQADPQHPLEFTLESNWLKRDRYAKAMESTS